MSKDIKKKVKITLNLFYITSDNKLGIVLKFLVFHVCLCICACTHICIHIAYNFIYTWCGICRRLMKGPLGPSVVITGDFKQRNHPCRATLGCRSTCRAKGQQGLGSWDQVSSLSLRILWPLSPGEVWGRGCPVLLILASFLVPSLFSSPEGLCLHRNFFSQRQLGESFCLMSRVCFLLMAILQ